MTHALPPLAPAGAPSAHSGEIPPLVPTPEAQAPSTSIEGAARIITLEGDNTALKGTVNQMAADVGELMALLRAPNRTSLNSTQPPGYGPTVDLNPWVPPTHAPKGIEAPAMHAPAGHPANVLPPSVTLSAAIPLPLSNPTTLVPPPMSIPVPALVYAAPPSMVFLAPSPHAPAHTSEPLPFQAPQPHIRFSYPALPPINIPILEPGTPTQAIPIAPPKNFLPETGTEQGQRLKNMEENIRALQSSGSRPDAGDGDWSLFPGMRLPPKIKVLEFQRYHGRTNPRHHLCHYRGKMLQYWDYEEFVIHTFQDSLAGAALDWYMSLKAADIPTSVDLLSKFIDQYKYLKWRARAAKHVPPISEAQVIQLFHSTLKGAYYFHLLAHTSLFSNLIDAGKKLDIGVKLGKIEGPAEKKEGKSANKAATRTSSVGNRRRRDTQQDLINSDYDFDPTIQNQSWRCKYHQGAPDHTTDNCRKLRERIQQMIDDKQLTFDAVKPPNVQANSLPDHGSSSGPSINMISICAIGEYETGQEASTPFVIEYVPTEAGVGYAGFDATPTPFVIKVPAREPYQDSEVPWTYEGSIGNLEHQFSVMGVTRSGWVYKNPEAANKRKAPAATLGIAPKATLIPQKKVTEEEAEAFMKIIKASEYKVVEQMGMSPAHISLLTLLLISEPHREALLKVLTAVQVPKETAPDLIEETVGSTFSNNISFSDDELPSEGYAHLRALHIVYECGFESYSSEQDSGSSLQWFAEGSEWRDRPSDRVPSTLHQKLKFIVEERLITVKGEEDYAIYKEMVVPYISIGDDQNLPFHSFNTISVIRDYKKIEEYKNRTGLDFRPSCHEIIEAHRGKHLHRLVTYYGKINRSIPVPPLSRFFSGPQHIVGGTLDGPSPNSDDALVDLPGICTVTEETPSGVYIRLAQENEELNNWNLSPALLGCNRRFEGLDEDARVLEIDESLHRLENRQVTSVEPTKEINVGTEEEPRTLKIGTSLDPTQRARMIDFLKEYQE
ncbi:hypothetical protein CRG98_030039, partial [Punica granatum]